MKKHLKFCFVLLVFSVIVSLSTIAFAETYKSELYPIVRVVSYEVIKGSIEPGESFEMEFTVENSNVHSTAYNILIGYTVKLEDTFYINMGETNQVYIEKLEGGETTTFVAKLNVVDYAVRPVSVLSFSYYYENEESIQFENTTDISPEITLNPPNSELDIKSLIVSENADYNEDIIVTAMYSNIGETDLRNIKLIISGNIQDGKKTFDLGSLNVNEHDISSVYINFTEKGKQTLLYSFTYEDSEGLNYTTENKETNVIVAEKQIEDSSLVESDNIFSTIFDFQGKTFKIVALLVLLISGLGILINILLKLKGKRSLK